MSERYNVEVEDVLGENYKITNIECSDYNPTIDGNITVTITVTDVYGDAVSGESVTVTASEGTFTQLNGSDITSASSVTGTTNSSGQFTLTYNCTEWGLITFNANNTNIQINVVGFKAVESLASGKIKVFRDEKTMLLKVMGSFTRSGNETTLATTTLKPLYEQTVFAYQQYNNSDKLRFTASGGVILTSTSSSGSANVYSSIYLPIG